MHLPVFRKTYPSQLGDRNDEFFMKYAFNQAVDAFDAEEVPVGAVIVRGDELIGAAHNEVNRTNDPTAHAEILAITQAANIVGDWRLNECTLFVTKEPCPMCAGAIINSRISQLVFGAYDEEKGACGSLYQLCGDRRLDSKTAVKGGVEEEMCIAILQEYFQAKRNPK